MKTSKILAATSCLVLVLWAPGYGQIGHMVLTPQNLNFTAVEGKSLPVALSFTLVNSTGSNTISWSLSDDAPWLNESPLGGVSSFQVITVAVNSTNLAPGHHSASVLVTSPNVDNSPQAVAVAYEVVAASSYGDANCDGVINAADIIYVVNYVFKSGAAPGCP